jgi:uncharacterized YigZ family protein
MQDSYLTIEAPSTGLFKDRGSKFLAFAYPVDSEDVIKNKLEALRKEFHDARHHCYAYRLHPDGSMWRANDDGEPGSSAGKPILNQIDSRQLTDTLVVVVRYFGGTLLGVSGLIHAYRSAASDALDRAEIVEKYITRSCRLEFPYGVMNDIMRLVNEYGIDIASQEFTDTCVMHLKVRASKVAAFSAKLELIECHLEFI